MADRRYVVEKVGRKWAAKEIADGRTEKTEINDSWAQAVIDAGLMRRERRVTETIGFRAHG